MRHVDAPAAFFALLALLALAACADDDDASKGPKLFCPQVAVLQQTASLTEFLPSSEDVTAEITQARVTGVAGSCTLEPGKHAVKVSFKIGFTASNGPANKQAALELPYFVSIVHDDEIIAKTNYTIGVGFDGNVSNSVATSKTIELELPNRRETAESQVLVGFQLSPSQLAYAADHPGL